MASTIKTKSSNVASKVPTAGQIETGELAINFPDRKIYTKDPSNNIIEMGGGGGAVSSTFTVTLLGSTSQPATPLTATGNCTKVGNLVSFSIGFLNIDTTGYSGLISFSGLPYTNRHHRAISHFVAHKGATWGAFRQISGITEVGGTEVRIKGQVSDGTLADVDHSPTTGAKFWVTGTYQTN